MWKTGFSLRMPNSDVKELQSEHVNSTAAFVNGFMIESTFGPLS